TLADLADKQLAVMKGDNAEEFLRRNKLGATIVTTKTFDDALRQLAAGRHDAVVLQKLTALQLINNHNLANLKTIGPPLDDFVQSFCFAVRKGDRKLLALLNEGLSIVIADGTFRHLRDKWFGPIEALEIRKSRIIIGGDANYPPYEFLDENGQPAGFNVELTRAIARQAGIEVDIQLRPWAEIREGLATRGIDAIEGMFYSPERDVTFDFSPPHSVVSHVIVVRKGMAIPRNLEDLKGKSILVMQGDIMHDAAVKQGYAQQLVPVASQEEALRRLASGQHDCALVAKVPALYWIEKHDWRNLHVNEQPVMSVEYCFAVPHGNSALLDRLSEGLAALKETGEYRRIYSRWLGVYEKPELSAWEIFKYSLFGVVPMIGLLFGSILWSKSLKVKVNNATTMLRQEIEERKRTEEALRESIDNHRAIFSNRIYAICICEVDTGRLLEVNDAYAEMFSYSREELLGGMSIFDLSAETELSRAAVREVSEVNSLFIPLRHYRRKDGTIFPVEIVSGTYHWKGRKVIYALFHDIAERKLMEDELHEKNVEMERFVYTVSHDLKSPIVTIKGFLGLLDADLQAGDAKAVANDMKYLHTAADRIKNLLDDLLEMSRVGRLESVSQESSFRDLAYTALAMVAGAVASRQVEVIIADADVRIWGDHNRLLEIWQNLLENAVKYMGPQNSPRIDIGVGQQGGEVVFFVRDNGLGIEPQYHEKIFGLFDKLDPDSEGTGLGLALVKRIVELNSGRIWVESKGDGSGSCFYFTLPAAVMKADA
ncbi:MAG: transporter substrate-binding domain-containing protein, partial [Desulfuromonadales bacterium]